MTFCSTYNLYIFLYIKRTYRIGFLFSKRWRTRFTWGWRFFTRNTNAFFNVVCFSFVPDVSRRRKSINFTQMYVKLSVRFRLFNRVTVDFNSNFSRLDKTDVIIHYHRPEPPVVYRRTCDTYY